MGNYLYLHFIGNISIHGEFGKWKIWTNLKSEIPNYSVNIQLNKGQISADILLAPLLLGVTLIQIYLFCYFGNSLSNSQEDIADYFHELNWHELPVQMQKLFLLPIMAAQNPIHMYAFGSIECTSETFTKVLIYIIQWKNIMCLICCFFFRLSIEHFPFSHFYVDLNFNRNEEKLSIHEIQFLCLFSNKK